MSTPRQLPVTVYTPDSSLANPFVMIRAMMADLWKGRELAWRLTVRDISAQYRQTFLGLLWALILPLANTAVWLYLNLTGIVVLQETPIPYPVYVFSGTMLWAIFMDSINAPMGQTNAARGMLTKLNFPREALLLAGVYKTLFNSGIKIVLLLGILPFFKVYPSWGLALFPLGIISLILVGTAIGLFITPVGMLYTDVGRGMPLVMQFIMYATPVVFAMPKSGLAATLFKINPLTPLILTTRDWLTGGSPELIGFFLAVNAVGLLLLLASWIGYRLSLPILIERMSA
ncbi:MAG: ABC transporter permease [Lentisphaerae bacterium]|nr:ABC transporter permease [Lentisphaerota bacterium]